MKRKIFELATFRNVTVLVLVTYILMFFSYNIYKEKKIESLIDYISTLNIDEIIYEKYDSKRLPEIRTDIRGLIRDKENIEEILRGIKPKKIDYVHGLDSVTILDDYHSYNLTLVGEYAYVYISIVNREYMMISMIKDKVYDSIKYHYFKVQWDADDNISLFNIDESKLEEIK